MKYDNKRIKKQIQAESSLYSKFGPVRVWSFILTNIFQENIEAAKEFMLSQDGGYSEKELNRIIAQKEMHHKMYIEKLIC